jgi:outer membrane protein OmpA-like peptidoglycan-associated protein
MKIKLGPLIFISLMFLPDMHGQTEAYTVTRAPFSSDNYDEFAPAYYKNGIVFCTNRNSGLVLNYGGSDEKGLFNIYFVDTTNSQGRSNAKLFSKSLTTKLNDGPVSFNRNRDTIFYSRNINENLKEKELSGSRNKLGIFSAQLSGNDWIKIREFRLNNEWFNITTPCLSPDGSRLYFASDMPGGYGGSDLYYSQFEKGYWNNPVNLGKEINTSGNESYPFINLSGGLFFSSDGHPGLGGRDIFFSRFEDNAWLPPVHLSAPLNSPYDDFGFITDPLMEQGYFSSNRGNSIDIYYFKTNFPQIFYSRLQSENQYCFLFNDSDRIAVDTTYLKFRWSFGDGKTSGIKSVSHCYGEPGNYKVSLDIIDRRTGSLFFTKLSYNMDIKDIEQPYINSPDLAVKGDIIEFDALKSFLPGFEILNQSWDFGDGMRASGETVKHSYEKAGEYRVNLGLTLKSGKNGEIHKKGISKIILVLPDLNVKADSMASQASAKASITGISDSKNAVIKMEYSAESENQQPVVYMVEVLKSENKVELNSSSLQKIPKKYKIREIKDEDRGLYSYCIDRQMSLIDEYPVYRELLALGFKDARVRTLVLTEPSEIELYNLIKSNGSSADTYFDSSDRLTSVAYIMLDQIVKLMNKYPSVRIEVSVNSDNKGSAENILALTQKRSGLLVNYIVRRGISANRLVAKGFSEPVFLTKERRLNQRVDFNIVL